MMEEKNKYVKLRQMALQTITELREQVKVQENETEIQRSIVINKDRCVYQFYLKIWANAKGFKVLIVKHSVIIFPIFFFPDHWQRLIWRSLIVPKWGTNWGITSQRSGPTDTHEHRYRDEMSQNTGKKYSSKK